MPRRKTRSKIIQEISSSTQAHLKPVLWLKAVFYFHVFHYRMPNTVTIASITSFVPSPLTVKMSMIASLLQRGEYAEAELLAPKLPSMEVKIVPPSAAFSFKAFLRYRSAPTASSTGKIDESGSFYPSRPHIREYALFTDDLTIYVGLPDAQLKSIAEKALRSIRYLGCKDSLTWCKEVQVVESNEAENLSNFVRLFSGEVSGDVILSADFASDAKVTLKNLIPSNRKEKHYRNDLVYVLPGKISIKGRTRVFIRT